jgi:hypothetical protein
MSTFLDGAWRVNYANVLDSFEINMGTTYYPEFPMVPTLRITLCDWTSSLTPAQSVGEPLFLEFNNGTTWQPWFFGKIISVEVVPQGNETYLYNLVAEAPWRFLASETIGGGGYPAQTDADRIEAAIEDASNISWEDLPSAYTWANLPADYGDRTWAGFGAYTQTYVGFVATGATYDLIAYADGAQQAMGLLDQFSADVRGRWYSDCRFGELVWRDYSTVASYLGTPLISLDQDDILELNTSLVYGVEDINNVVTIDNGTDPVTSVADIDSIRKYGQRDLAIQSWLVAGDQASVAGNLLSVAAMPRQNLSQIDLLIRQPEWDASRLYDVWSRINNHGAAELTGIPAIYGGDQTVFITGADVVYNSGEMFITCRVLNEARIAARDMWTQVDSTTTWAAYPGTTIWANA